MSDQQQHSGKTENGQPQEPGLKGEGPMPQDDDDGESVRMRLRDAEEEIATHLADNAGLMSEVATLTERAARAETALREIAEAAKSEGPWEDFALQLQGMADAALPPASRLPRSVDVGAMHRVGTLLQECEGYNFGAASVSVEDLRWLYVRALTRSTRP